VVQIVSVVGAILLLVLVGSPYEDSRWGFVFELPPGWTEVSRPAKDPYAAVRFAAGDSGGELLIAALPRLPDGEWLRYESYVANRGWTVNGDALSGAGWRGRVWILEFDDVHFAIQLRAPEADYARREREIAQKIESFERIVIPDPDWHSMDVTPRPAMRESMSSPRAPAWASEERAPDGTRVEVFYGTTRERVGDRWARMLAWLGGYALLVIGILLVARRRAFSRIPVWTALAGGCIALCTIATLDGFPLLFGASALLFALAPATLRCLLRRRWHFMVMSARVAFGLAAIVTFVLAFTRSYQTWDQQRRVGLAYGTGRAVYASEWGCETGICTVSIPEDRSDGEIPLPTFGLPDPARHFLIAGVEVLDTDAFRRRLARHAGQSTRKDALLFVHGYNNTFNDAVFRVAQIAHDLEFNGAPILFSWPSKGDFLRYSHDEAEVIAAGRVLGRFLAGLSEIGEIEHLYVVGHSMGCRVLGLAMQWMRSQGHDKPFDVIVLAAPDIDAEAFRSVIAPEMRKRTARPTLYVSRNDSALKASHGFHGYRRAGDAAPAPIVVEGIDTIDVSRVCADHSYIGTNFRVMSDLGLLIERLTRATDRLGPDSSLRFNKGLGYFWIDDGR